VFKSNPNVFDMILLEVVTISVLGILVLLVGLFINLYNKLQRFKNAVDATLGQIRVSMKKRLDMIEQLLGAVKGYSKHERELFESIAKLRASVLQGESVALEEINRESRRIVRTLIAIAEAYPELKASETVTKLMDSIVDVEDEIARHRYTYNNVVQEYNTMQDTIPSNLVGKIIGANKQTYLQFEEEISRAPDVSVK
jgi:LemA protein